MYGAGTGHFLSTIAENTLPFNITLAVDTTVHGRGFVRHLARCPQVVGGLEDIIKAGMSDVKFSITGYIIHSPVRGIMSSQYKHVWQYQAKIISLPTMPWPPRPYYPLQRCFSSRAHQYI